MKHPVTEAASATEKPGRKLILVPEAGLNKQHHMLGSEQRQSVASRWWGSAYLLAPSPPALPKQLSSVSLLLSLLCAHWSTRGGVSAPLLRGSPGPGNRARAGSAARGGGLPAMRQGPRHLPSGALWSPGTAARDVSLLPSLDIVYALNGEKTGRARNLEKVEDCFGNLLFKNS